MACIRILGIRVCVYMYVCVCVVYVCVCVRDIVLY